MTDFQKLLVPHEDMKVCPVCEGRYWSIPTAPACPHDETDVIDLLAAFCQELIAVFPTAVVGAESAIEVPKTRMVDLAFQRAKEKINAKGEQNQ